ncbi:MAG: uncharacterized membrane protein YgdD (TMEM256/DUF423 family) [Olleya marilimosa]|jgi:uncharacterized membrane protein YgdD (TMEM256/DUF423 family)|uniref:DUF423 domain-containing protein n=1 Tax=Olleya marilimosa TaxID=272164 RepID=UPI00168D0E4D|nr:DUF423 domain-containing protein [Olleya marilimosa]MBD3891488.1 DUF423 domain-containing protein [Olleya marilimosa]|tara:strand:+ start:43281 stop:43673 length:393 start_codon:yes stop_codon:yes gene_type:complete
MNKKLLLLGTILGLLSVILGAFGAHGLKALVSAEAVQSYETGVRYQMYHALLLLVIGSHSFVTQKSKTIIFYLVLSGILLFSGSIYGLATNTLTAFNFKSIAFVTPIGGLLLILSWLVLLINILKIKQNN